MAAGRHTPTIQSIYLIGLKRLLGSEHLMRRLQLEAHIGGSGPSFAELARSLEAGTDPLAAKGLSLMAGREAFDMLLPSQGEEMGLLDAEIRMLPLRRRIVRGISTLIQWMNDLWGMHSELVNQNQELTVNLKTIPGTVDEGSLQAAASFMAGLIQGMLFWLSGGKFFPVRCETAGSNLEIIVSRSPID